MDQPLAPNSLTTVALSAIVSGLERVEQRSRSLEAERLRLLAEAFELAGIEAEAALDPRSQSQELHTPSNSRGELALRAIRAEIAVALRLSERTVDRQLSHAHALAQQFPSVLEALSAGEVSPRHASVIVDAGSVVGSGGSAAARITRGAYAMEALEAAGDRTPAGLSAQAKRIAERYAAVPLDERHADARRQRRVWVEDREHGMADLYAHLPATEAYAIKDRLTRLARGVAEAERASGSDDRPDGRPDDRPDGAETEIPRRRDEIRADVLTDLLLRGTCGEAGPGPAGGDDGVRAVVQLIVPAGEIDLEALLQRPSEPGPPELLGYGPIDADTSRRLLSDAPAWDLLREDAAGRILSVDRYRPSERMRRLLRARDRHCRFPGCRVPVHRCDLDQTVDAAFGGETSTANLAHLCRGHHVLKHQTGWRVRQRAPGELEWTSPTGRTHRSRPPGEDRAAEHLHVDHRHVEDRHGDDRDREGQDREGRDREGRHVNERDREERYRDHRHRDRDAHHPDPLGEPHFAGEAALGGGAHGPRRAGSASRTWPASGVRPVSGMRLASGVRFEATSRPKEALPF